MLNATIRLKVEQRLNKISSLDYDNISCWQVVEAFNKGQIEWCRRQLWGKNLKKEGDKQTTRRIDDLQILLTPVNLLVQAGAEFYESNPLPADYLEFKRVDVHATSECCPNPKKMIVYLTEETNVSINLRDELKKPNFEWAETFCTLVDNKIRIYTNGEFAVKTASLMYYRNPRNIQITGCVNPYTGLISAGEVTSEFKDDIVELLIDNAASILAGDIEAFNQYQRLGTNTENNN